MNEAATAGTGADDQTLELNYQLIELRHLVRQSVHWLGTHAAQIAIALVVGIALYLLMNLVKRSLCRLRCRRILQRTGQLF